MIRDSEIFEAKVDVDNGFFVTKRRPRNIGAKHSKTGYRMINLRFKGQKAHSVLYMHHAIFFEANGITELPKGFQIHHANNNKEDNRAENLYLCSAKWNSYCAAKTRDYAAVYESRKKNGFKQSIRAKTDDYEKVFPSMNQAAQELGICISRISQIINGKTDYTTAQGRKTGLGYTFERV